VAPTRSRPRGRESAHPSSGGVAAEHATKIYAVAISATAVAVAFLALTGTGHVIDAATQNFMLYYAGVFSLIALCASVGLGLVATDRMILNPGHRIFVQSAHRAASFGALAFLVIHIVTEILAQRVHVLDAFVPFLSPYRTFYIGLGTIASDLIVLLVITGIMRKRFTAGGKAWRWRAIHYAAYVAFVFGVWHGLLGGRPGKPYVDWSYGFVVAFVALGLAVRILANSLHPKEKLSAPPVPHSANSGSAPMRAASMFAQLAAARAGSQSALMARSGPQPMLTAPVGDWNAQPATGPRAATAALPIGSGHDGQQPYYEPGYEGPPRYLGTPRSGNTGPQPRMTGPMPVAPSGPVPPAPTGPMPRAATGPMPRAATGPMPRAATGPIPRAGNPAPAGGRGGAPGRATGQHPRAATGPMPRATGPRTGPNPRAGTGPYPRPATGPQPLDGMGPMQQAPTGPHYRPAPGSHPRPGTGPVQRPGTGPRPAAGPPEGWDAPPPRDRRRGDGQPRAGRGARRQGAPRGPAGRPGRDDTGADWNYGLPPWDGGAPEPDPSFRYREPGPGMPGYRSSRGQYPDEDLL
jgi:DMSO/TMAO reductase YedYZ heme-binding membrane subunit